MIENIIFSSGGIKGLYFLGCLKALEELEITNNLQVFVGCSVGSIIALLYSVGFTSKEMIEIVLHVNFTDFKDINSDNVLNFLENFGIDTGNKLMNFLSICLKQKTQNSDITFSELYNQTQKKLIIYGTCLNSQTESIFSVDTTPDMCVLEAVRISISIPLFYTMCNYNNESYVDGALASSYPITLFENELEKTIGFYFRSSINYIDNIDSIEKYMNCVLNTVYRNLDKYVIEKYKDYTILLHPEMDSLNFNLTKKEKLKIFDYGYLETIKFFHKRKFNRCLKKI